MSAVISLISVRTGCVLCTTNDNISVIINTITPTFYSRLLCIFVGFKQANHGPLMCHMSLTMLFSALLCHNSLRAGTSRDEIDEQAKRARKLQGDRLSLEDFAQFLNLPVTDTLTQVQSLFDQVNTERLKVLAPLILLFKVSVITNVSIIK